MVLNKTCLPAYNGNIDQVLNQVLSSIKLQESDIKSMNVFISSLIYEKMVLYLKEKSRLFKIIFKEIACIGSSFEGLKICKPDEFDLNFVFRLPVSEELLNIVPRSDLPGTVTVKAYGAAIEKLKEHPIWKPVYSELSSWTDGSGNLLLTKVKSWMEGLVNKFANEYNKNVGRHQKIKVVKSGPAITLVIGQTSIDVVPVFGFSSPLPKFIRHPKPYRKISQKRQAWYIVPKLQEDKKGVPHKNAWRMSFYQIEREILKNNGKIKPAIKLVKMLRDNENWNRSLFSYSIKTVALWMVEKNEFNRCDSICTTFIKLLQGIKGYVDSGFLPFYWNRGGNMLKMNLAEQQNYSGRLSYLIKKCKDNFISNPAVVGNLILKI